MKPHLLEKGMIFWFDQGDDGETVGQEDQKRRPWVILTSTRFHRAESLVWAAPITSVDNDINVHDVRLKKGDIRPEAGLSRKDTLRADVAQIVKVRKLRHISTDRIQLIVGRVDSLVALVTLRDNALSILNYE